MTELAMFAYPWDVAEESPEATVEQLAELGVGRIDIATVYHSAETIRPRRTEGVHLVAEPNVAHLPIDRSRFNDLVPAEGRLARESPDLYPRLAAAAKEAGVAVTGWTICLHQSDLAQRFPSHALKNCFGDVSAHGLCPTDPEVASYCMELCAALAGTGFFDELMLESLSYLLSGHGHPHELWAVRLDPISRLLLSLCFCTSCLEEGSRRGIDGEALRRLVSTRLTTTWNSPLAPVRTADRGEELAAMLVQSPELAGWLRMRCDVVTELLTSIVERLRTSGVSVIAGSGVWARPAALNWMEGIDISALARVCAGVALMPYHEDPADVARDLDVATTLADASSFQMLQTIWPAHHGSQETLLRKIELGRTAGITRFGLYNLAMAPQPVLGWVKAVADALRREPGTAAPVESSPRLPSRTQ